MFALTEGGSSNGVGGSGGGSSSSSSLFSHKYVSFHFPSAAGTTTTTNCAPNMSLGAIAAEAGRQRLELLETAKATAGTTSKKRKLPPSSDGASNNDVGCCLHKKKAKCGCGSSTAVTDDEQDGRMTMTPADYVVSQFRKNGLDVDPMKDSAAKFLSFVQPTEDMIRAYSQETTAAVRRGDLDQVKKLHREGKSLQCCNRFGESVIHMACRRGNVDVVRFMVQDAGVSLLVRDDYGRTPLHDSCWCPTPKFALVEMIVRTVPELLVVPDVRGHLPLSYVRKQDEDEWIRFLSNRKHLLRPRSAGTDGTDSSVSANSDETIHDSNDADDSIRRSPLERSHRQMAASPA